MKKTIALILALCSVALAGLVVALPISIVIYVLASQGWLVAVEYREVAVIVIIVLYMVAINNILETRRKRKSAW